MSHPTARQPDGFNANNVPPDPQYATYPSTSVEKPNYENSTVLLPGLLGATTARQRGERCVLGPSEMTGHSIASATATLDQTGQWVVDYTLAGSAGSALWDKVAQENFHQILGIELDGVVYSAPIIQPTQSTFSSFDGKGEISGSLTQTDAQNLAQAMNFGALPITLKAATSETVSATLGHSALVAGLGAGIAGLIFVLLYVLLYYRALGLVVISGLLLTAALLWAIISALGHTSVAPSFDLAGITGLIVSIGITVDSYIVYFERLKDETRSGRSVRTSVDRGFKSAWRTVWAADFVSLLAAIVLYFVAVGNVKGFAFFLGLSTIMDMAITWFYTRPLVILLGPERAAPGFGRLQHQHRAQRRPAGPRGAHGRAERCRRRRRWLVSPAATRGPDDNGSSLDDVPEDEVEQFEEGVDTRTSTRTSSSLSTTPPGPSWPSPGRATAPSPASTGARPASTSWAGAAIWFAISTVIILLGVISIILRGGLNLGIEFKGGTEWTIAAPHVTQTQATNALAGTGLIDPTVELLGTGSKQTLNVQSDLNKLSADQQQKINNNVQAAMYKLTGTKPPSDSDATTTTTTAADDHEHDGQGGRGGHQHDHPTTAPGNGVPQTTADKISVTTVGPTWGSSITNKAIEALIIFFIVVAVYISFRFEPKMALAAFIAMIHDVLVAVGIYSIFNFQVTPDTVVAILTILGYSLYDTVVVFDRVRDNTKGIGGSGRLTYPQLINLSMNQTLARSINTSAVAIIPVLAILVIGAQILGATTLQSYGLALFVGLLSGAYSSIFIASPVLCMMKEREDRWRSVAERQAKRGDTQGWYSAVDAANMSTQMSIAAAGQVGRSGRTAPTPKRPTPKRAGPSGPVRPTSPGTDGAARQREHRRDGPARSAGRRARPARGPSRRKNKGKRRS